jgi:hypothetical protein
MSDRVDAAVQAVQTPGTRSVLDRLPPKPEADQLSIRDHAKLATGQRRQRPVTRVDLFPLYGA